MRRRSLLLREERQRQEETDMHTRDRREEQTRHVPTSQRVRTALDREGGHKPRTAPRTGPGGSEAREPASRAGHKAR